MRARRHAERMLMLGAFCALLLTAWAYPLSLYDPWLLRIEGWFAHHGWSNFFEHQMRPWLRLGYEPLILKENLGALTVYLMFLVYWPWKLLFSPRRQEKAGLHLPLLILMAYAGVSLAWTPSFEFSLRTLEALLAAAFFFLMVSDLDWTTMGRRKALSAIACIGGVLVIVGFFQIIPGLKNFYYRFFYQFDTEEMRNDLPGWIGHNTEMSSYMLATLIAAIALLLTTKRLGVKILLSVEIIGTIVLIIAGRSRIIWPLAIILGPLMAFGGMRILGRRVYLKQILAVLVLLLVLCLPFAGQIRERIAHYGPQALLHETRTRILFVSQAAIRQSPWIGHGLGSFMSVYPPAQGDYFAAHPNSPLYITTLRTPQAHNDYLQLLIELGLVGFALVLIGLFFYLRHGAQGMRKLPDGEPRVIALAFILMIAQQLANATVNFPMHVPPAAYLFAFILGIWVAMGRDAQGMPEQPRLLPKNSYLRIALLVFVLLPFAGAQVVWSEISREMVARSHFQMGVGYLGTLSDPKYAERASDILAISEGEFRSAERLLPFDWETQYHLALLNLQSGRNLIRELQTLQHKTDAKSRQRAMLLRLNANIFLHQGIRRLGQEPNGPRAESQFHQSFFLAAQLYQELDRLWPGKFTPEIGRNLELAIRYSPVFYDAEQALMNFYAEHGARPEKILALARRMFAQKPEAFRKLLTEGATKHLLSGDYLRAAVQQQVLIEVDGTAPSDYWNAVQAYVYAGRLPEAQQVLASLEKRFDHRQEYWRSLALLRLAQQKDSEALQLAQQHGAGAPPYDPYMVVMVTLILNDQHKQSEAQQLWAHAFPNYEQNTIMLAARAQMSAVLERFAATRKSDLAALLKNPFSPAIVYLLAAQDELNEGNIAAAVQHAKTAQTLGVNSQELMNKIHQMQPSTAPANPQK